MIAGTGPAEAWYRIQGVNPEPWEASEGSVGRKGGKVFPQFHKPRQLVAYQEAIKDMFPKQNPDYRKWGGELDVQFFFWRSLDQFEMGEGRKRRMHVADATNLQKGLEDALQKILFENDRDNRRVTSEIVMQEQDITPFILIHVARFKPSPVPVLMRADLEVDDPIAQMNAREVPDVF